MRKAQIEKLRKIVRQKAATNPPAPSAGIAADAREAVSTPSDGGHGNRPHGGCKCAWSDDRRLLARFYAARLAGRDWDRTISQTAQGLATRTFAEALDALRVWKREMRQAEANGVFEAEGGAK